MFDDDLNGLSAADLAILFEPNPYSYDSTVTDPTRPPSLFVQVMRDQEERFYAAFPDARRAAEDRNRRKAEIRAILASKRSTALLHRAYSSNTPRGVFYPPQPHSFPIAPGHPNPHSSEQPHFVCDPGSSYFSSDFPGQQSQVVLASPPPSLSPPHEPNIYDDVPPLVPAIPSVHYHMPDGQRSHDLSPQDSHFSPPQHFLHHIDEKPESQPQPQPHPTTHHDRHPQAGQLRSPGLDSPSQQSNDQPNASGTITRDRGNRRSRSRALTPGPVQSARSRSNNKNSNTPNGLAWGTKRRTGTRASPLPGKRQQSDRKPTLACLFCRGRKIACGAPLPGSVDKTCNQCQRRNLRCEFPAESRRGMRKRKAKGSDESADDQSPLHGESILLP